ncbi:hypothetical protein K443DRAFT_317683 [Laccaria amethystina LaAM-08-1]|uniref:Uncharacterized protein n=1 Tax=Laccaria amethystina LaAM-08-1 TaxID=1095629 RepID=A0A0C9XLH2_9AGAR|nr:hypothetical protein K443DRAFT_317683 [Laccaria amethystina LaAM-08-1]
MLPRRITPESLEFANPARANPNSIQLQTLLSYHHPPNVDTKFIEKTFPSDSRHRRPHRSRQCIRSQDVRLRSPSSLPTEGGIRLLRICRHRLYITHLRRMLLIPVAVWIPHLSQICVDDSGHRDAESVAVILYLLLWTSG